MTTAARRRAVADAIDALDNEIATLQDSKRDTFDEYRDKLSAEGMRDGAIKLEIKALKKAIARRRALLAKPAEVEEVDEKIDEITIDIMKNSVSGTKLAARAQVARSASRVTETPHDPITGEVAEPAKGVAQTGGLDTAEVILCATHSPAEIAESLKALGAVAVPAGDTKFGALTTPAPYRIVPSAPAPEPVDPEASPLIADREARLAKARELLGQSAEAAE